MIIVTEQFNLSTITDLNSVKELLFYSRVGSKLGRSGYDASNDDLYISAYFDTIDHCFKINRSEDTIHHFKLDFRPNKKLGKILFNEKKTDDELSAAILKEIIRQYIKDYMSQTEMILSSESNVFTLYEKDVITLNQLKEYGTKRIAKDLKETLQVKNMHHRTKYPEFLMLLYESGLVNIDIYKELAILSDLQSSYTIDDYLIMMSLEDIQEVIREGISNKLDIIISYSDDEYFKNFISNKLDTYINDPSKIDSYDRIKSIFTSKFNTKQQRMIPNATVPLVRDNRTVMSLIDKDKWIEATKLMTTTLYNKR